MTLIKSHSCTKCGGALIVHNDRQQYECPYCSVFYDYEYFRSRDILDQADSSMKMLQYDSAREKYEFLLKKDPHSFRALRGILLCDAKINRPSELSKPENLLRITPASLNEAEGDADPEEKPYFAKIRLMYEIAKYTRANQQEKERIEKAGSCGVSGDGGRMFETQAERSEALARNREKSKRFSEDFSKLYKQLLELEPEDLKETTKARADEGTQKENGLIQVNLKVSKSCASCGGELIVNLDRQVYECPFCGVTYDFDFIRDETAMDEAQEALAKSQFLKADAIYAYILTVDPKNFTALRGRILCAAKWTGLEIASKNAEIYMRKAHIPTMKERVEDAVSVCETSDRPYFEEFVKIFPEYEDYIDHSSPTNRFRMDSHRLTKTRGELEDEMDMLTEEQNKYLDERDKRRKDGTFLIEEVYYLAKVRAVQKEIDEVYDSRSVVDEQLNETVEEISKLSAEAEHSIKLIEKHLRTLVKIESDRDPSQKTIGGPEDK